MRHTEATFNSRFERFYTTAQYQIKGQHSGITYILKTKYLIDGWNCDWLKNSHYTPRTNQGPRRSDLKSLFTTMKCLRKISTFLVFIGFVQCLSPDRKDYEVLHDNSGEITSR